MLDFTDYQDADLVADGTIAIVQLATQPDKDTGEYLKPCRDDGRMFNLKVTVVSGQYARWQFWNGLLVEGGTDGQKNMAGQNKKLLKQVIDSALNLKPDDKSPEARAKRSFDWPDFNGLRAFVEIGIDRQKPGSIYGSKNFIKRAITNDSPDWKGPIEQNPNFDPPNGNGGGGGNTPPPAPSTPPIVKPSWAS
jgi:hypothetical protein